MVAVITKGGIRVTRDVRGNLVIEARGNGSAHVQAADVDDLRACLDELDRSKSGKRPVGG